PFSALPAGLSSFSLTTFIITNQTRHLYVLFLIIAYKLPRKNPSGIPPGLTFIYIIIFLSSGKTYLSRYRWCPHKGLPLSGTRPFHSTLRPLYSMCEPPDTWASPDTFPWKPHRRRQEFSGRSACRSSPEPRRGR